MRTLERGLSFLDVGLCLSNFFFMELVDFVKLRVLILQFLDDNEQFFYLCFIVADELEVLVYLFPEGCHVVICVFDCEELPELNQGRFVEIASIVVLATDRFYVVEHQFLDSEVVVMSLNVFLKLLHLGLDYLHFFLKSGNQCEKFPLLLFPLLSHLVDFLLVELLNLSE